VRLGTVINDQAEDVGAVVVAHRVEQAPARAGRVQVKCGWRTGFLLADQRPGQHRPVGADDDRVAVEHPVTVRLDPRHSRARSGTLWGTSENRAAGATPIGLPTRPTPVGWTVSRSRPHAPHQPFGVGRHELAALADQRRLAHAGLARQQDDAAARRRRGQYAARLLQQRERSSRSITTRRYVSGLHNGERAGRVLLHRRTARLACLQDHLW
jgi:hypothetical protein